MPEAAPQLHQDDLPLQRLWRWETERAGEIYLTQPLGGGAVRDFTWADAVEQARRMAAHLQSFGWEPGTRVAILSKNCAWWLLADYAIWMAGYVSVPIYPTLTAASVRQILEHSEAKACFIGKLHAWDSMAPGIPEHIPRIAFPLAPAMDGPQWEDLVARTAPGWSLLVRPCPNLPRSQPIELYEGIIETDRWFGPLFTNLRLVKTDVPIPVRNGDRIHVGAWTTITVRGPAN